jgi:hypothetical protein
LTILAGIWLLGWAGTVWETRSPKDAVKLLAIWPSVLWEIAASDRYGGYVAHISSIKSEPVRSPYKLLIDG